MTTLRLLADDLTGALDSAARFVPLVGPVPTFWTVPPVLPAVAAIDGGTRERAPEMLQAMTDRLASTLDGADIAFKKIDSLLRGWVVAELNALMPRFDHCIVAPAFPFQGRITRGGRQLVRSDEGWRDVGVDLVAGLATWGDRLTICDAESDDDLDAIVARGRALGGRVLWCGTGGLAGALTGRQAVPCPNLPRPVLALIGSDHTVSAGQIAAAAGLGMHHVLRDATATTITRSLHNGGAVATVAVPPGTPRDRALSTITAAFVDLLRTVERPGTLIISGGETLRAVCVGLAGDRLDVDGEIEPGVPTSILRGGAFDGQRIVSKSGAFGGADFLTRTLGGAYASDR